MHQPCCFLSALRFYVSAIQYHSGLHAILEHITYIYIWSPQSMSKISILVVCDGNIKALIWITINADVTMRHHNTQQLNYLPFGAYNDKGDLMVCEPANCQPLKVITLPDINPYRIARLGD